MNNKKYKIKNTQTGNFVSEELSSWRATEYCAKLTEMSNGLVIYEVVEVEDEKVKQLEDASPEPRAMDDFEKEAAREVYESIGYPLGAPRQKNFAKNIFSKVQTNDLTITEKQAAYLWNLIYRYRRQIKNKKLIEIAEERKVY